MNLLDLLCLVEHHKLAIIVDASFTPRAETMELNHADKVSSRGLIEVSIRQVNFSRRVGWVGMKLEALPGFLVPRMMALASEEKASPIDEANRFKLRREFCQ
jgi:hypothetical protein